MTKEKLRKLLSDLRNHTLTVDEASIQLEELIDTVQGLKQAMFDKDQLNRANVKSEEEKNKLKHQ
jgi:hypothetical protein